MQRDQAVPTRGTTPAQVRAFLALNQAFARPVSASPAKQWGRVRGREQIDLLTSRVTAGWFEENHLPSQQRAWAVIRCGVQARVQARHQLATVPNPLMKASPYTGPIASCANELRQPLG
jgi:hypothetical protein